jgi:hypothetical protein
MGFPHGDGDIGWPKTRVLIEHMGLNELWT